MAVYSRLERRPVVAGQTTRRSTKPAPIGLGHGRRRSGKSRRSRSRPIEEARIRGLKSFDSSYASPSVLHFVNHLPGFAHASHYANLEVELVGPLHGVRRGGVRPGRSERAHRRRGRRRSGATFLTDSNARDWRFRRVDDLGLGVQRHRV